MKSREGARTLAFRLLRRVEREGAFASILLQHAPRGLPREEVALLTELVYGVLRHRLTDEFLLAALSNRSLSKLDPDVVLLFRIAAHQILRLDRVPERAAVNESVEIAKGLGGSRRASRAAASAGFLNAVLRRLCRDKDRLPLPAVPDESAGPRAVAEALAVRHSHPAWLVERWLDRWGAAGTIALLEANNLPAPSCLAVNTARAAPEEVVRRLAAEGIEAERLAFPPGFLEVRRGSPAGSRAFEEGLFYIQDRASGIVPHLLAPAPGARVLDACSAPGGKTLALARMAGPSGRVVAADGNPGRVRLVTSNAARLGVSRILTVAADMRRPPFRLSFDAALVDAPCSGTGVFRRDPESRYRLAPADLIALAIRQREILDAVAPLVKPGGTLVYSVCSLEREEGEDQVAEFLSRHPDFARRDLRDRLEPVPSLIDEEGAMRSLPHVHAMDGFHAAALVRERG
ncbi:MAG TPA: 16S rRNA (cytosine(967)-C(5))-methyltransferase RsmB [Candidatus Saccharimonadales bacterium]|nr:16S rRNA (cytosine(967)-C(5))-methyltransferase RsmB [Candidatus Saccharimonadales bacterium]